MATIQGIYVALFGRPADPAGLAYFNSVTKDGADLSMIGDLTATAEYGARFQGMAIETVINTIYKSLFGRDAEPAGLSFFANAMTTGKMTINTVAIAILDGAQGSDLASINAKIAAANLFTAHLDLPAEVTAYAGNAAAAIAREYVTAAHATDAATPEEADAAIARLLRLQGGEPENQGPLSPIAGNTVLAPLAEDGTRIITKGDLLANVSDPQGLGLTIYNLKLAGNGVIIDNGNGTWTFTPAADDDTQVQFTYSVTNGWSPPVGVTASLDLTPVDDAPIAVSDSLALTENSPATVIDVGFNDTDVDGGPKSVTGVTQGAHGAVVVNGGVVSYQPDSGYAGTDTFTYALNGGSTATVTVKVNGAPAAVDDSHTTVKNHTLTVAAAQGVLANDTDANGDTLVASVVSGPSHGTLVLTDSGAITYVPNSGYTGTDSFTYLANDGTVDGNVATVNITVDSAFKLATGGSTVNGYKTIDFIDGQDKIYIAGFTGPGTISFRTDVSSSEAALVSYYNSADGQSFSSGAGTVTYRHIDGNTLVLVDSNNDGIFQANGDVMVKITGLVNIDASDFTLTV